MLTLIASIASIEIGVRCVADAFFDRPKLSFCATPSIVTLLKRKLAPAMDTAGPRATLLSTRILGSVASVLTKSLASDGVPSILARSKSRPTPIICCSATISAVTTISSSVAERAASGTTCVSSSLRMMSVTRSAE